MQACEVDLWKRSTSSSYKGVEMSTTVKPLRIDIPVQLNELRIAFSIADLAFEGIVWRDCDSSQLGQ